MTFVGQYRGDRSNMLADVLIDKGQLQLQISGKKHALFAGTPLHFYQEGEFLKANFDSAVKPRKMVIENFFGVENFARIQ